jgi:hypothetical protein
MGGYTSLSLQDYMGLPTLIANITHSNLHLRAYNLIYNEWFRDQNLQGVITVDNGDGPDDPTNYVLLRRGKRHDYFTSCLPWPQKDRGVPVEIPLGTTAPVLSNGFAPRFGLVGSPTTNYGILTFAGTSGPPPVGNLTIQSGSGTIPNFSQLAYGTQTGLYADLTDASAATINQLREAFQIQKMYERDARGGTRYVEIIKSHFNVISPDFRLQRPEYLGGGSSPININPVAQTSGTGLTGQDTPQGNLSAFGTVSAINHGFVKSFTEHCLIIGMVSVRADYTYQQGMNRLWSRQTRFDFYWPALSHIGEQAVLNQEIYVQGTSDDGNVFGYQERFAEYRYKPSIITGAFRSNYSTPLDAWHLSQDFGSLPTLGPDFIVENPPMSRIKAVTTEPDFIFDSFFHLKCARPMPVYGVPGLIDHF